MQSLHPRQPQWVRAGEDIVSCQVLPWHSVAPPSSTEAALPSGSSAVITEVAPKRLLSSDKEGWNGVERCGSNEFCLPNISSPPL